MRYMDLKNVKPTEVKIDDLSVVKFFDDQFLANLKKEIGDASFQHFCIFILDKSTGKPKEKISIAHDTPDEEKKNIITISATTPELLNKVLNVIKMSIH